MNAIFTRRRRGRRENSHSTQMILLSNPLRVSRVYSAILMASNAGWKSLTVRYTDLISASVHGQKWGPGITDAIRYFGERDKIFYVHFRDVEGHVPKFAESFCG